MSNIDEIQHIIDINDII